jgi:hypothetical protein
MYEFVIGHCSQINQIFFCAIIDFEPLKLDVGWFCCKLKHNDKPQAETGFDKVKRGNQCMGRGMNGFSWNGLEW